MTDTPSRLHHEWRTLDFKPAPPGWRAVYLNPDKREVLPVAGWLVQEECLLDMEADRLADDPMPERRVIPGICTEYEGWGVEPVDRDAGFMWMILAPGEPESSEEEEQAERARRTSKRKRGI